MTLAECAWEVQNLLVGRDTRDDHVRDSASSCEELDEGKAAVLCEVIDVTAFSGRAGLPVYSSSASESVSEVSWIVGV